MIYKMNMISKIYLFNKCNKLQISYKNKINLMIVNLIVNKKKIMINNNILIRIIMICKNKLMF